MKFDIYFLRLPCKIFFGVITDNELHLLPLKNVKKNATLFKLFWYKVFVHLKLKVLIRNFVMDSVLNLLTSIRAEYKIAITIYNELISLWRYETSDSTLSYNFRHRQVDWN